MDGNGSGQGSSQTSTVLFRDSAAKTGEKKGNERSGRSGRVIVGRGINLAIRDYGERLKFRIDKGLR